MTHTIPISLSSLLTHSLIVSHTNPAKDKTKYARAGGGGETYTTKQTSKAAPMPKTPAERDALLAAHDHLAASPAHADGERPGGAFLAEDAAVAFVGGAGGRWGGGGDSRDAVGGWAEGRVAEGAGVGVWLGGGRWRGVGGEGGSRFRVWVRVEVEG